MTTTCVNPVTSYLILRDGVRSANFTWDRQESEDTMNFYGNSITTGVLETKLRWFLGDEEVQYCWLHQMVSLNAVEIP